MGAASTTGIFGDVAGFGELIDCEFLVGDITTGETAFTIGEGDGDVGPGILRGSIAGPLGVEAYFSEGVVLRLDKLTVRRLFLELEPFVPCSIMDVMLSGETAAIGTDIDPELGDVGLIRGDIGLTRGDLLDEVELGLLGLLGVGAGNDGVIAARSCPDTNRSINGDLSLREL